MLMDVVEESLKGDAEGIIFWGRIVDMVQRRVVGWEGKEERREGGRGGGCGGGGG